MLGKVGLHPSPLISGRNKRTIDLLEHHVVDGHGDRLRGIGRIARLVTEETLGLLFDAKLGPG